MTISNRCGARVESCKLSCSRHPAVARGWHQDGKYTIVNVLYIVEQEAVGFCGPYRATRGLAAWPKRTVCLRKKHCKPARAAGKASSVPVPDLALALSQRRENDASGWHSFLLRESTGHSAGACPHVKILTSPSQRFISVSRTGSHFHLLLVCS